MIGGSLTPGTILGGDFRILRPLQAGGMGAVYIAEQLSTGQQRALKIMHPGLVQNPRLRERFEQEARVGSRIASEHVVQVIAAGIDAQHGIPWLAMELLSGQTLAEAIEAQGRFDFDHVLRVFRPLCHALGAAHAVGIVHRDIKPENLFLAATPSADRAVSVKVLDFGIAKLVAEAQETGTANIGSPLWMAPEQSDPRAGIGPAADIWPLGLIAYRMLTGHYYWKSANDAAGSMQSLMRESLIEPIAPASFRASEQGAQPVLPAGFDAWFARAVDREPSRRFRSASEALSALERLASERIATTTPAGVALSSAAPARPAASVGSRNWIAAGAIGFLALGALAVAVLGTLGLIFRSELGEVLATAPPETSATPTTSAASAAETSEPASAQTDTDSAAGSDSAPKGQSAGKPAQPKPGAAASSASGSGDSALAPFNRSAATAKVNAAAADASSRCRKDKGDASIETYTGSIGFNPDGSRTTGFMGTGGARNCVYGIMANVKIPKYAPNPDAPWTADVVQFKVSVE